MDIIPTSVELDRLRQSHRLFLLYITGDGCGVCTALKPKILAILSRHPGVCGAELNAHRNPEPAAQLSVFTIPAVVVYLDGKEMLREARYFSVQELESRIERLLDVSGIADRSHSG